MSNRETIGCTDYEETEALEKRIAELRDAIAEIPEARHNSGCTPIYDGGPCYCGTAQFNAARAHARKVAGLEES